jgi:hypothetical protein
MTAILLVIVGLLLLFIVPFTVVLGAFGLLVGGGLWAGILSLVGVCIDLGNYR